jgi:hypothetical protein
MTAERLRFRLWGWLSGLALERAARAASDCDDVHEAIHCMAAWHVGQSDGCTPEHHICSLDAPIITSAEHGRGILPEGERDALLGDSPRLRRYRAALEAIRDQEPFENALDSQWAARVAASCLDERGRRPEPTAGQIQGPNTDAREGR